MIVDEEPMDQTEARAGEAWTSEVRVGKERWTEATSAARVAPESSGTKSSTSSLSILIFLVGVSVLSRANAISCQFSMLLPLIGLIASTIISVY